MTLMLKDISLKRNFDRESKPVLCTWNWRIYHAFIQSLEEHVKDKGYIELKVYAWNHVANNRR